MAEASELLAKLAVVEATTAPLVATATSNSSPSASALSVPAEHQPLLGMLHAAECRADSLAEQKSKLKSALQVGLPTLRGPAPPNKTVTCAPLSKAEASLYVRDACMGIWQFTRPPCLM
jgi:hypothetical protein